MANWFLFSVDSNSIQKQKRRAENGLQILYKSKKGEQKMGCKFFRIYFIEVKCLNRQSTAMSLIILKNLTHFGKQYTAIFFFLFF